jgi:hypothetical protein
MVLPSSLWFLVALSNIIASVLQFATPERLSCRAEDGEEEGSSVLISLMVARLLPLTARC